MTIKFEIAVSDVDRSRTWYSEVLGWEPVEPNEGELVYRVGGALFGMYESDHAGSNKATTMRLILADFDAVRDDLSSKGVVFEDYDIDDDFRTVDGVLHSPDGEKTSWFKDPDGNIIALGTSL